MGEPTIDVRGLPDASRAPFQELGQVLLSLAGADLLSLTALGGWLSGDPLFAKAAARSVAIFRRFDLRRLDQFSQAGVRLGKRGLSAPLIMTPEHLATSRDTFPLELLEIQQLHTVVYGEDFFAGLTFARSDIRVQCERELKSELIQLRQGLLSAAGDRRPLATRCGQAAERAMRVLRGLLQLAGGECPRVSAELVARGAEVTGLPLATLREVTDGASNVDFALFERFYGDLSALADYVNALEVPQG